MLDAAAQNEKFRRALVDRRMKKRLGTGDTAKKCGVPKTEYLGWEKGKKLPTQIQYRTLCGVIGHIPSPDWRGRTVVDVLSEVAAQLPPPEPTEVREFHEALQFERRDTRMAVPEFCEVVGFNALRLQSLESGAGTATMPELELIYSALPSLRIAVEAGTVRKPMSQIQAEALVSQPEPTQVEDTEQETQPKTKDGDVTTKPKKKKNYLSLEEKQHCLWWAAQPGMNNASAGKKFNVSPSALTGWKEQGIKPKKPPEAGDTAEATTPAAPSSPTGPVFVGGPSPAPITGNTILAMAAMVFEDACARVTDLEIATRLRMAWQFATGLPPR